MSPTHVGRDTLYNFLKKESAVKITKLPWQPKSFREIEREAEEDGEHHHYRYHCVKCGTTETCRCSAPKTDINGICPLCEVGLPVDGRDRTNHEDTDMEEHVWRCVECGDEVMA